MTTKAKHHADALKALNDIQFYMCDSWLSHADGTDTKALFTKARKALDGLVHDSDKEVALAQLDALTRTARRFTGGDAA